MKRRLSHDAYQTLRLRCRAELTERAITIRQAAAALDCNEKHLSSGLAPSGVRQPGLLLRLADWLGIEKESAA